MYLYCDNKDISAEPIYEEDLIYMGKQIRRFVTIYRRDISLMDEDTIRYLNQLEYIADRILTKDYAALIKDPSIIKQEEPITWADALPDDYPF